MIGAQQPGGPWAPKHVKTALLKRTKFNFGWGYLPKTPLGELTVLPQIPPADPSPVLGPPGLETTCLPKYVSPNPPLLPLSAMM